MKKFYKGQIVFVDRGFNVFSVGYYKKYKLGIEGVHIIVFNKDDLKKKHTHSLLLRNTKTIYKQAQIFMRFESETSYIEGFKFYKTRKLLIETRV